MKCVITGRATRHYSAEIIIQSSSFQYVTSAIWKCELAKIKLVNNLLTWAELSNYSTIYNLNFQYAKCHYSGRPITKDNELLTLKLLAAQTCCSIIPAGRWNKLCDAHLSNKLNLELFTTDIISFTEMFTSLQV